jgi:hypothetical protein
MTCHLDPTPELFEDDLSSLDETEPRVRRPAWWRWVAVVVAIALVVATPFAYTLYRLLG